MKYSGEEVAVCFVSNMSYLPHFYVALFSFVQKNTGGHHFFLFNEDIPKKDVAILKQWLKRTSAESSITDMKLDTSVLPNFSGYWQKLGKQVFHRLLIPNELPATYRYALYLDADLVFLNEFKVPEEAMISHTISAIRDSISDILAPKRGLEKYFNAGIMLINIRQWKKKNALNTLLTHTPKKTLFAEQELLNEVFAGDWFELDQSLNYPASMLVISGRGYRMKNNKRPKVVHFLGGIKPWKLWVRGSALYWRYIWKTPYRRQILLAPGTILNSILHLAKKPFR